MSPLKISRRPVWLIKLDPNREESGRNTQVVQIAKTDSLKFENDYDLRDSTYAGVIQISDEKDGVKRNVQLNRGDRAIIQREGSSVVYVVDGVDWSRRR